MSWTSGSTVGRGCSHMQFSVGSSAVIEASFVIEGIKLMTVEGRMKLRELHDDGKVLLES